jgi:hypothetical protein
MNIREEIVTKVQKLPESSLPEVYEFVEKLEAKEEEPGLLRRLQKIKIQGPPDFSRNIDLYLNGEKKIEDNVS